MTMMYHRWQCKLTQMEMTVQYHTLVDSTSMNEECVAVDAVGSMPKLQLRVDCQVCEVRILTREDVAPRRPTSPTKHTQNPTAGKIRDDW